MSQRSARPKFYGTVANPAMLVACNTLQMQTTMNRILSLSFSFFHKMLWNKENTKAISLEGMNAYFTVAVNYSRSPFKFTSDVLDLFSGKTAYEVCNDATKWMFVCGTLPEGLEVQFVTRLCIVL